MKGRKFKELHPQQQRFIKEYEEEKDKLVLKDTHEIYKRINNEGEEALLKLEDKELRWIYAKLVVSIWHHDFKYHGEDDPIIEDFLYDKIYHFLEKIVEQHPEWSKENCPTKTVGYMTPRKYHHRR